MSKAFGDVFKQLIKDNKLFFFLSLLFLLIAGGILLFIKQGDAIFFFSNRRSTFGDLFFTYGTRLGEEVVYLVVLLILLMVRFRYAIIIPILGFSVSVISYLTKTYFGHDRPSLYFRKLGMLDEINLVEGIVLNGGTTSFPSGHTMSAFALYAFFAFCLPHKKWLAALLFLIALVVGISRIYLVQHFLQDVYLGAILGLLVGMSWYWVQSRFSDRPDHWVNRKIRKRHKGA